MTAAGLTRDQLDLIYNNTNDLIFLIGVDAERSYRVISVNRQYLASVGLVESEIVGRKAEDVLPPEQFDYVKSHYDNAIKQHKPYRYETRTELGKEITYIDTTLVPVFDDSQVCTHLIGVSRDITRNKLEQKELSAEKARAENYLNIAEAVIVAIDRLGNISMLNPKGYQMLGYPDGSLTGQSWSKVCIDPLKHDAFRTAFNYVIENEEIPSGVNYIRTRSGEKLLIRWSNAFIRDAEGNIEGILSSGEDITDRHRAEKAMIASQRVLAAGEVVSAVAHDFNNSLQGILGNIEIALSHGVSDELSRFLETASKLAEDAAGRLKVLQQAAGEYDESEMEAVPVDELIEDVITQTRHLWKDEVQRQGHLVNVFYDLADSSLECIGNRSELRTVLYNIIKNAIESIFGNGEIRLASRKQEDQVVISVEDSGHGMDTATSTRIFQPFFSTKGLATGRGLGMSASFNIINAHHGAMSVRESRPGHGTTIEIRLPLYPYSAREAEAKVAVDTVISLKVLWVDDDPAVRGLAAHYIQALGYEGDIAESGEVALGLLHKSEYDVVVTDIGMPGMNGIELAEKIKRLNPAIPIVALTGWGESAVNDDGEEEGFSEVLAKPVRLNRLRETLEALMG